MANLSSFNPHKDGRNLLGLDSPLNDKRSIRIPNAIQDWLPKVLTRRERSMILLMDRITDKVNWNVKVFDEEIVRKWRAEANTQNKLRPYADSVSESMFDYCIAELRDYARLQQTHGFIPAIDAAATVYKSDTLVSETLRHALVTAAAPLEDVPASRKDWHPGSHDRVLDLVHPSLFPLLYGRSKILTEGQIPLEECDFWVGNGETMPVPVDEHVELTVHDGFGNTWNGPENHEFYSRRFQWLPCEVAFADDNAMKITSYINNLHPKNYTPLYEAVEAIIAKAVPMWNDTLSSLTTKSRPARIKVDFDLINYIEPEGHREPEDDEQGDDLNEDEIYWRDETWLLKNRTLVLPEPGDYTARSQWKPTPEETEKLPKIDLRGQFSEQGLQVIVKLANIHLSPEKPDYGGGSWHIEGQLNEHICASAIYYYESDNVTDSFLGFRETLDTSNVPYYQSDWDHTEPLFGIHHDGPAIQNLGEVLTRQGRLITFPNVLQHKVSPFALADRTRPGHRKILALFLVDPFLRIPSTANVPPQQSEWWGKMVSSLDKIANLPVELAEHIVDSADDFPIGMDEAKSLRLELMAERKAFSDGEENRIDTFYFCEH